MKHDWELSPACEWIRWVCGWASLPDHSRIDAGSWSCHHLKMAVFTSRKCWLQYCTVAGSGDVVSIFYLKVPIRIDWRLSLWLWGTFHFLLLHQHASQSQHSHLWILWKDWSCANILAVSACWRVSLIFNLNYSNFKNVVPQVSAVKLWNVQKFKPCTC